MNININETLRKALQQEVGKRLPTCQKKISELYEEIAIELAKSNPELFNPLNPLEAIYLTIANK